MLRLFARMIGTLVAIFGIAVFLFGLLGHSMSSGPETKGLAWAMCGIGITLVGTGYKLSNAGSANRTRDTQNLRSPESVSVGAILFDDVKWGSPPPTRNQFAYGTLLGAQMRNGMTREQMSEAIEEAQERLRKEEAASEDQLKLIAQFHGVLPRQLTHAEADRVIQFLEQHQLPCPFCRNQVFAMDDSCCECGKSLQSMRIPLHI